MSNNDWQRSTSETYRQLAQIAVPQRMSQITTLLTLIPFAADASFTVLELASGEGHLAQAIVQAFPNADVVALDYEESMREATAIRLDGRGAVAPFDIRNNEWFDRLDGVDVVVSSLCIHHLDGIGKQRLFNAVSERTSERGTLLVADLIAPELPQAHRLFAATWDDSARTASETFTGDEGLFTVFEQEEWNLYHYPDPEFDKPSPLFSQLKWLNQAGFGVVDCFWMYAGHAIYGGYKQVTDSGLDYATAHRTAREVLGG